MLDSFPLCLPVFRMSLFLASSDGEQRGFCLFCFSIIMSAGILTYLIHFHTLLVVKFDFDA